MGFHYSEQSHLEISGVLFDNTLEQSKVLMKLIHIEYFFLSRILVSWKLPNEPIFYQALNTADKFLFKLLTSQSSFLSGALPSSDLKNTSSLKLF